MKAAGVGAHVVFVEVLQHAFPFRQDEPAAEVLTVVSAPFPQKALSVACQGGRSSGKTQIRH